MNLLDVFSPLTARWFERAVGTPTAVQEAAWPVISAGGHVLVSAPTGTGKTLSAFLVFIDRLMEEARQGKLMKELQLIYVSPLKSLAGDIRENLRRPLEGILQESVLSENLMAGIPPSLSIAIRTGDTPQKERRRMIKSPPHILITTPESLYLMLTSKTGQSILHTARWIIIDELHALIDSKRGAHMMLSIARLDKLCPTPLQRIGLSATIEPLSIAAEYLSPVPVLVHAPVPVTIVAPKMRKEVRLEITSQQAGTHIVQKDSIWQEIAGSVYAHCKETRSVIAFVDGRAYAEKLAHYVNQIGGEGFARTHHGSLSKEQRFEVEHALRNGTLRLLCATSSMELGIDVGEIDEVFQIGCPRSISSTMQRLGRAGHNPGRTSTMYMFSRAPAEGLYCGLVAEVVRCGGIEYSRPPRLCLDVLAQHLVSMATGGGYSVDEVMELLIHAYPFRDVTRKDVQDVLRMLAGDYEHDRDIPVRPRILYDRIHDRVEGDAYSRMLAVSAAGTIPDKGQFTVRTQNGVKLGELDEEFVFEKGRIGNKFLLGTFSWQITEVKKDVVIVKQTTTNGAIPPYWKAEIQGRRIQTGLAFGEIFRKLSKSHDKDQLLQELGNMGLDTTAAHDAQDLIKRQIAATGALADDRTMLIEHYRDDTGNHQMMVHAVFGRPVNEPLAILATLAAKRIMKMNINYVADDDGFLLFPYEDCSLPKKLLHAISPGTASSILSALLPATPIFNMAFRYNAGRALMMGVRKSGRQPLWVQRMRSADMLDSLVRHDDHPLIRETKRECLEDYWDLNGVEHILNGIRVGTIHVLEMDLATPSPMSMQLRRQTETSMMYDYTPTPMGIHAAALEALDQTQMIAPSHEQLAQVSAPSRLPENENQLHSQLMIEGDLIAGEKFAGDDIAHEYDVPSDWLETLEQREQAKYIEPGLWIAAEHADEYHAALIDGAMDARLHIVRRLLRYRGAQASDQIAARYFWPENAALELLESLCESGEAIKYEGLYYHAKLFDRAQKETVKMRRKQIRTHPPERYAALLSNRLQLAAAPGEKLEAALKQLCGLTYPALLWESILIPARVEGYRPELLDALLAKGNFLWRISPENGLSFHQYDDIDWDADMTVLGVSLEGDDKVLFDALQKRGASFMQRLSDLITDASPLDTLLKLTENGIVCADSFAPVRQLINRDKTAHQLVKQRVKARVMAMTSGRWELSRPLKEMTLDQQLERAFDRSMLLCRETAQGLNWGDALKLLRTWEYTGRVRRGYFIEGLSGMQYIREKYFDVIMQAFEQPNDEIIWLPAVDPMQPWGKYLAHDSGRSFQRVPGTVVALRVGVPIAVFERQGNSLSVFDGASLPEALQIFAQAFKRRSLFPALHRLTLKEYPPEAENALRSAGFGREMQDYVLYRA